MITVSVTNTVQIIAFQMCRSSKAVSGNVKWANNLGTWRRSLRTCVKPEPCYPLHRTQRHSQHAGISKPFVTAAECVKMLTEKFDENCISESRVSAEYIVAHVCGKKTMVSVPLSKPLSAAAQAKALHLASLRMQSVPIQYVIGEWDFRDITLNMRTPVFIPRPETEELVDLCMMNERVDRARRFLELGCGSGAICISLLKALPQCRAIAVDKLQAACELTSYNAELNGVSERLEVKHMDITTDNFETSGNDKFDFIVSNPPYIPTEQMSQLQPEIKRYEYSGALDGGDQGLDVIGPLLTIACRHLKHEGFLWLEVDSSHPEMIRNITESNQDLGLLYRRTVKDFNGWDRFCELSKVM